MARAEQPAPQNQRAVALRVARHLDRSHGHITLDHCAHASGVDGLGPCERKRWGKVLGRRLHRQSFTHWFTISVSAKQNPIMLYWARFPKVGRSMGVLAMRNHPFLKRLLAGPLLAVLGGRLLKTSWTGNFALWAVVSVAVAAAAFAAWPALGRLLLAYAYAARIPVALVAAAAVWKHLGTHYDVPPPGFPAMPQLSRWLWIGLLPQMTIWVAWTVALGVPFSALGWLLASRRPR